MADEEGEIAGMIASPCQKGLNGREPPFEARNHLALRLEMVALLIHLVLHMRNGPRDQVLPRAQDT